jgi:hypothetical protein
MMNSPILSPLTVTSDKETRSVSATLSPKREPRIVKIDDYYVEASPRVSCSL